MRGVLALAVTAATIASGCAFEPTAHLTARPGDFAELTVGAWHEGRLVWGTLPDGTPFDAPLPDVPRHWFVMATTLPRAEPPPLVREDLAAPAAAGMPQTMPQGLIASLTGHAAGEVIEATLPPALAFGPRLATNVVNASLDAGLARVVHVTAANATWAAVGTHGPVRPFFAPDEYATWGAELVRPEGDGYVVRLTDPPQAWIGNATLGDPRFCAPGRCLFLSRLVGLNETHLLVRHEPVLGEESSFYVTARVAALDHDNVTVDYNHPLAGLVLQLKAGLHRIAPPVDRGAWRAPLFEARALDGARFVLADHLDRPVVLEFFATWCPSCIVNARDRLPEVRERWGDRIVIASVNVDPFETDAGVRQFVTSYGVDWPVVPDGARIASEYRVGTLSTDVLIAPGGDVAYVGTGEADVDRLDDEIARLLGATAP